MGFPPSSLSFRFAFVVSLSFAASYTSSSSFRNPSSHTTKPSIPKASAQDLLRLLGSPKQTSSINPVVADELNACLRFLVPFSPVHYSPDFDVRRAERSLNSNSIGARRSRNEENELIWRPPAPVMELARLAVDSGGDPGAIQRGLDPTMIPVPDIEGSKENRCELTRTPYGRRFINEELNSYLEFLFEIIVARSHEIGFSVSLSRYDFFHGHIFLATGTGRLGILFHAKEFPACNKEVFPYNMGYCQKGSNVTYGDSMNLRNILWLAPLPSDSTKAWLAPGVLVILDAHPDGIIYRDLIPEYVDYVRTIYEGDFGDIVADVNYLNVGGAVPEYNIFIC